MPQHSPPAAARRHRVACLIYEGLCAFEFGIAAEVFGLDRPEMGAAWYGFTTCSEQQGTLATNAGLRVAAARGLDALDEATTIVVPGWPPDEVPSAALRDALLAAHDRSARLVAICSGAFLLASIGLLAGRRATTHWRFAARLQAAHATILVDANVLYVEDRGVFTSAGSAAGIDLLLHLVRLDFGAAAANDVARRMVVAPHRSGGQAQFLERPLPANPASQLAALLDRIRAQPARSWTVAEMADVATMSRRTLIRRFQHATGLSPGAWLAAQRLALARELLETTPLAMERIADATGMGSAANLRLHFAAHLGIPPTLYRKQFRRSASDRPVAAPSIVPHPLAL